MAEEENEVRWDGLCSRDPSTRETALENIRQIVVRKVEHLRAARQTPSPAALDAVNRLLAHLLMLSQRCPFPDVREKSELVLKSAQIITFHSGEFLPYAFQKLSKRKCKKILPDVFT